MEWIEITGDSMPPVNEYVLIFSDGYIGISRLIDDEWDTGDFRRRPMFSKTERSMSKLDAEYWMPLPNPPVCL